MRSVRGREEVDEAHEEITSVIGLRGLGGDGAVATSITLETHSWELGHFHNLKDV